MIFEKICENVIVDSKTGCWIWTKGKTSGGYGEISTDPGKIDLVHRVMWKHLNGPIPKKGVICHSCDNPPCCNPDHLFLGTQRVNLLDAKAKGRLNPAHGSRAGKAKLTADQVMAIREKHGRGLISHRRLAKEYGITHQAVQSILTGKNWGWL
ncbi:MAG: HNH endonuclease [Syntrophobacteraceae bacterium]